MSGAEEYLRNRAARLEPSGTRLLCHPDEVTEREAQNLRLLHQFVLHLVQETPERDPFVPSVVLEMHRICVAGIYPSGGRFREMGETVEVPGAGFAPAPVYRIESEIPDLLARVRKVVDSPVRFRWRVNYAALALHRFLRIHPFLDGNGRVGRAFHQIMLYKLGVLEPPLIVYDFLLAHRNHYLRALRAADSGRFLPWFHLNQVAVFDARFQQWLDRIDIQDLIVAEVIPRIDESERQMLSREFRLSLEFDEHNKRLGHLIARMEEIAKVLLRESDPD